MSEEYKDKSLARWIALHVIPSLFIILLSAVAIFGIAGMLKPEAQHKPVAKAVPMVVAMAAHEMDHTLVVESEGTVEPRTQTDLIAEVSGRVLSISPSLYAGSFFHKGDVLVEIDPTDYKAAVASAQSRLSEAQLVFEQEKAASKQAMEDWQRMSPSEEAPSLVLRQPQLDRAQANLTAAMASLESAKLDLQRTQIRAPYNGRVKQKTVDVGQILNARSSRVASIYATDIAEVRLAISLGDLDFLDLPEAYPDGNAPKEKPTVELTATYGQKEYTWVGRVDRSEGNVDPNTRLLYVVAQIDDPYGSSDGPNPPLKMGTFVKAKIFGERLSNVFEIPREALHEQNLVYVISPDNTLQIREVDVIQKSIDWVIVDNGIKHGDLICLSALQYVVDGMSVKVEPTSEADNPQTASNSES